MTMENDLVERAWMHPNRRDRAWMSGQSPVSEYTISGWEPLVLKSDANARIQALEGELAMAHKERDAALDHDWVAAPAYAAKVTMCREFRDRAERAEAVNDAIEINAGLTENGNLWRFWADKARELADKQDGLIARVNRAEAELARKTEALRPFANYFNEDHRDEDNKGAPLPAEQEIGWAYLTYADFRAAREANKGDEK